MRGERARGEGRKGGGGDGLSRRRGLINPKAATEYSARETDKLKSEARRLAEVTPAWGQ